jgi:hypothetical protein
MIGFLDLPGEIRNLIYDHLLVFDQPIVPWAKEQALPINLLHINNKTIYHEFGSLFYSRITFDFSTHRSNSVEHQCHACSTKRITSFLDEIGQNAKHIQSIKTDFPFICYDADAEDEGFFIATHSVQIVDKIQTNCSNLKELVVGPVRTLNVIFHIAFHDLEEACDLVIAVDEHFREISSLEKIKIRVPNSGGYYGLMDMMEDLEWEVEMLHPLDPECMSDEDDEDDEDEDDDDEDDDDYEAYDDEDDEDNYEDDDTDEEEGEFISTTLVLPSR